MDVGTSPLLSVSGFLAITNQVLDTAYPTVLIEGEVSGFRVNRQKFVFFDLKDAAGSVGCFMTIWALRLPIKDGMQVVVQATPKLTDWGRFSLTVRSIRPVGQGTIRQGADRLRERLTAEGLFAPERKRPLPARPRRIALVSSPQAAGYADFLKILNDRWGGVQVQVWPVQVQGEAAPGQIVQALARINQAEDPPDVIALVRGGGSADDLAAFSDEQVVRAIAASRVPTVVGVGHQTDTSLADLAADVRAATPSAAAQLVVPDKAQVVAGLYHRVDRAAQTTRRHLAERRAAVQQLQHSASQRVAAALAAQRQRVRGLTQALVAYDPQAVLARGYALIRGRPDPGAHIRIITHQAIITAEVTTYEPTNHH